MEKKIGILGHVDHGKTTLSEILDKVVAAVDDSIKEPKTIHEIIEEERGIKITNTHMDIPEINPFPIKSGQESRRERRALERLKNKNN